MDSIPVVKLENAIRLIIDTIECRVVATQTERDTLCVLNVLTNLLDLTDFHEEVLDADARIRERMNQEKA